MTQGATTRAAPRELIEQARACATPLRSLYPFEPHFHDVGGAWLHYVDEGPRDGETLLCVHGNPTWSFLWRDVVREFSQDRRVIAPDHVGCGLSEKPRRYPYTLAQHVENLVRLVRDLDLERITLCVHDWGGAIGMGLAQAEPERIERLVITNTAAFRSRRIPLRIAACRIPVFGRLAVEGLGAFHRAATFMAVARPLPPLVKRGYLAPYTRPSDRAAGFCFVQDIPLRPDHPSYDRLVEIEKSLAELRDRPTCIVWGMRDWCFTPEFLAEWRDRFPDAEVHEIEGAGHYLLEDAGTQVLGWLRSFLASHP